MVSAAAFVIACFVSINASPWQWVVSGEPARVARVAQAAAAAPGGRILAQAENDGVAFARLELGPEVPYDDFVSVLAATRGEHVAFGDTGVVIYSNSVGGARSNFARGLATTLVRWSG